MDHDNRRQVSFTTGKGKTEDGSEITIKGTHFLKEPPVVVSVAMAECFGNRRANDVVTAWVRGSLKEKENLPKEDTIIYKVTEPVNFEIDIGADIVIHGQLDPETE